MGSTGYIDWHRITRPPFIADQRSGLQTCVFAFWTVDYGRSDTDHGVTLLKREGGHPDWFIHSDTADQVLAAYAKPDSIVNPAYTEVFDALAAKPLLASVLLGTSAICYREVGVHSSPGQLWWASEKDLTRPGRKLMKALTDLYLRPPTLVTFINPRPMKEGNPGARVDQATVD